MPVAGNAVLQDAQDALNDAIDQVGDTVTDIVDKVQDTPTEPAPVVTEQPVVTDPTDGEASGEPVAEVHLELIDIPGYMPGTANGVALLQTTRVDSPTHPGWVDMTLDLMLTSLIPEEAIKPSINLNADSTLACFPASGGGQDCLGVEWGTKEQFKATLLPHPLPSEVWPKGKGRPWTVVFEIPANAQIARLVYGNDRVLLNLGGDQIALDPDHELTESYRPGAVPRQPAGTDGYFVGHNHGIAVTSVNRRPHAAEPTWDIIDMGIEVMTFADGQALDLPIEVQAQDGLVCYAAGGDSDCVQILWGGINQFNAILTSGRSPGSIPWPRSKGWPTTISFVVPSSISGATLLYGPSASHLDLRGEEAAPLPWDYTEHYNSLTGLTLHDDATQTIDLVALERDPATADVRLVFEAVNRSENKDFFPRISYDGSRVSAGGQVFDGLDAITGWGPMTRTTIADVLAPGQESQIVITIPRVSGPGFPAIPHSDDPPTAMLLHLYADTNPNAAAPFGVNRSDPFYVAFEKKEGDDDASFFFPDLEITGLALSPEYATVGDIVTATFQVANIGPRNAQATTADLLIDGVNHKSVPIPAIPANESTSVDITWVATLAPAVLTVAIDPANVVAESSVSNNVATTAFDGGALPDLTVSGVKMIPPSAENGNVPRFEITVQNQGTGNAKPYKVVATAVSGSVFFMQFAALKAGASAVTTYPWTSSIGTGAVILSIDAANAIQEADETNNVYTAGLPDLTAKINLSLEIADDGSAILLFEVTNDGEMAAPSAQIQIIIDGQTSSDQIINAGPWGIGESIAFRSGALPGEGRHRIEIRIDPLGRIPEADSDNNAVGFSYTIGPLAELVVTVISLEPDPFTFGELLTLEFVVANQGGKKSEATVAKIYDPGVSALLGTVSIPVIEPGEQSRIKFEWTVETALTSVEIVLDPDLLVDEEDEENNTSVMALN